MRRQTKHEQAIRVAAAKGYHVSKRGTLISSAGNILQPSIPKGRDYPTVSINVPKSISPSGIFGILVHKLAAFCFYGERTFASGLDVRHKNGDVMDFSKKNIKLGTRSQNEGDKPREVKSAASKKARRAQPYHSYTAQITYEDALYIRKHHRKGKGGCPGSGNTRVLMAKFGVSKFVILNAASGKTFSKKGWEHDGKRI